MQIKNEADIVEYSLRALAYHTDAIIVLDDNSEDNTLEVLNRLATELNIIEIIKNQQSEWIHGSEVTNRQKLLDAGRKHGGTHFIEIDADEVFTTHCAEDNWLREKLLSLKKGQILQLPLINLWKNFDQYRSLFTNNFPDMCYCTIGYCDDGESDLSLNLKNSHPGFLHFGRFPHKTPTENYELFVYEDDINRSIIHLPFINWTNVIAKKVWIMMLEVVRLKEKLYNPRHYPSGRTKKDISNFYTEFHNYDDSNATLSATPTSWLNYSFFKKEPYVTKMAHSKLKDIQKWTRIYGKDFFDECPYIQEHLPLLLEPLKVYISGWAPEITSVLIKELENHNISASRCMKEIR
jgi:glycosyltransferase involved in cell wall biosynthesis